MKESHCNIAEADKKEENAEDKGDGEDALHFSAAYLAAATRVENKVRGKNENLQNKKKI